MCEFSFSVTQHNATDVLRERAIGVLTAGMSTRVVAHELNVHLSTISHLQSRFREFGSTSNQPHDRRSHVTTPAQDLHIQHLHLQDHLRPATRTAAATIGLYNQIISAQTVRNRLREAHLLLVILCWCKRCGSSGPWWRWGYGMGRCMLWTLKPLKRSGPTLHRPQSTTWSTLCEGDVLHCVRQMVVTPDTDWFSDPPQLVLHVSIWVITSILYRTLNLFG